MLLLSDEQLQKIDVLRLKNRRLELISALQKLKNCHNLDRLEVLEYADFAISVCEKVDIVSFENAVVVGSYIASRPPTQHRELWTRITSLVKNSNADSEDKKLMIMYFETKHV